MTDQERLQAEAEANHARLRQALKAAHGLSDEVLRLRAENGRLKEALEKIAAHDNDRWEWEHGLVGARKPSPQELATDALAKEGE